jgi:hypothetical protein
MSVWGWGGGSGIRELGCEKIMEEGEKGTKKLGSKR